METYIIAILAIFASTGFWQFLIAVWQERKRKSSAEREALKVLLHDRLFQGITYYLKLGCTDVDGFDNITHLYKAYHSLGGNGTGTELYNRFTKLQIKEKVDEMG